MKRCKLCGLNKSFLHFFKDKQLKDGYKNRCKHCYSKRPTGEKVQHNRYKLPINTTVTILTYLNALNISKITNLDYYKIAHYYLLIFEDIYHYENPKKQIDNMLRDLNYWKSQLEEKLSHIEI